MFSENLSRSTENGIQDRLFCRLAQWRLSGSVPEGSKGKLFLPFLPGRPEATWGKNFHPLFLPIVDRLVFHSHEEAALIF